MTRPAISIFPEVGWLEASNHVEDRGLAATAGAQQAEELAVCNVQVEIADGDVVAALHRAKDLADASEPNQCQGNSSRDREQIPSGIGIAVPPCT